MRTGSAKLAKAFRDGKRCRLSTSGTDGTTVWYHHNKIAWRNADQSISFTLAGWGTMTTRERLNTIYDLMFGGRPFHQKDHVQYFDVHEIGTDEVITVHPIHTQEAA